MINIQEAHCSNVTWGSVARHAFSSTLLACYSNFQYTQLCMKFVGMDRGPAGVSGS